MVQRAHKIRLYPTKAQEVLLAKTAGTVRYAYNWGLAKWNEAYKNGDHCDKYSLCRQWTMEKPEWANEVAAGAVQHSILNLGTAFHNFFQKRTKHPDFHKKGRNDSFYLSNQKAKVVGKKVRLEKIGYVKLAEPLRYHDCRILSYVVSRKANKWYVSIQVELDDERRTESTEAVGIDVGVHHWAVASDGTVLDSPAKLRDYERRLKRKQRLLSRKAKGSKNRAKACIAVAKAYVKITNTKQDAIHKFTSAIAKRYGTVCLETLDIEGMKREHRIAQGIQMSALGEIHRQLMYKCNNYVQVDKYFPSSKQCSKCHNKLDSLSLSTRTYQCPSCGQTIDRDLNAAINLLNEGKRIIYGRSDR